MGIVARRAVCGASWGLSGRKKSADRSRRRFSQNNCDIPPLFRGHPAANPPKIGPFPHLPPPVPPFPAFLRYVVPVHPEICISKYPNIVMNERAYSLPMKDPRAYVTFDQARQYCQAKGKGWHLMSNAEWAAIALWCKKNGYTPQGNTNYGANHAAPHEKGVASYIYDGGKTVGRTYTGSGPVTWAHDKTAAGIYDLCGNVWEWASGLRLKNGELQVIKDNDSAMGVDEGPNSSLWRAITQDGSLVAPGTAGTLKYDNTIAGDATQTAHDIGGAVELSTTRSNPMYTGGDVDDYWTYQYQTFESLAAKSGVTVPELLKVLGLFPLEANGHDGDGLWVRNYGERLPLRGGGWNNQGRAGVFALGVNCTRVPSVSAVGFRAAFVNL